MKPEFHAERDAALERAIADMAELQTAQHKAGDTNAYNVHTMITMLKGMRRPEVAQRLDSERLQRARAA